MRLILTDPAATRVVVALPPEQLSYALGNATWDGLTPWWTEDVVYEGHAAPPADRRTEIDRARPGDPPSGDLLSYAVDRAGDAEQGGTVWNGWPTKTDERARTMLNGELNAISIGVRVDGEPWVFRDRPRPLTNEELKSLSIAVRLHVRKAVSASVALQAGIAGGAIASRAQVDAYLAEAMA